MLIIYYGYHRVSTKDQRLDRGIQGIEYFCKNNNISLEKIFVDKMSGKTFERPRYTVLKEDVLRPGDTLIVYELNLLTRNKKAISEELRYYEEKGIRVMILDIPTTTMSLPEETDPMNKLIVETINKVIIKIYSMQAESEMYRKEKRQREGIEAKKARGEWDEYGRQRIMSLKEFAKYYKRVENGEIGSLELMRQLKMKKSTYFKYVNEYRQMNDSFDK